MSSVLKSMLARSAKVEGATVHGFRSSFADCATESTAFPAMVVEGALAHSVGSAVSRAYRRTDTLARRRALLEEWGRFCTNSTKGSNLIRMLEARAGGCMGAYASEIAWREDNRRVSNGEQYLMAANAALNHPVSRQWSGYWRRYS
jgi:hypothetical protein